MAREYVPLRAQKGDGMKLPTRVLTGIASMLLLVCFGLSSTAAPASAQNTDDGGGAGYENWTCKIFKQPNQYVRDCGGVASRPGIRATPGHGIRSYPTNRAFNSWTDFDVTIKDTWRDGRCAYLRFRVTGYSPVWFRVCGKGKTRRIQMENIQRRYFVSENSYAKLWICRGKTKCKHIWTQSLVKNPYLKS